MDRNSFALALAFCLVVALRKESVDRNQGVHYDNYNLHWSLSVRRAWIEILVSTRQIWSIWSLSVRRAWIEMSDPPSKVVTASVALRKESVDRNSFRRYPARCIGCRSP